MSDTETPTIATKAEIITKIGRQLEEKRKARGLSLEKVSQNLKIKQTFLKSIELGQWQDLPGEVYARGFITRYAQSLGLDPKEILLPYTALQNSPESNGHKSQQNKRPLADSRFPASGFIWGGVGLAILIGILKMATTDQAALKSSAPAAVHSESHAPSAAASPSAATANEVKNLVSHNLTVYSPFQLWLSVKTESRSFEGFLPEGSTWNWKGEGTFAIRLGHTQQVALEFDGKPIPISENQKRVVLPSEN